MGGGAQTATPHNKRHLELLVVQERHHIARLKLASVTHVYTFPTGHQLLYVPSTSVFAQEQIQIACLDSLEKEIRQVENIDSLVDEPRLSSPPLLGRGE
mmetsp:Transcript_21364/g.49296  ORF Transcript_21364/g.49296 Transcript_21364/m.49296 type:complete len:99 (+) Transcript_21364:28-324(+)